jgi:hypothetical protein
LHSPLAWVGELYHPKEVQDDKNDRNNEQRVNPVPSAGKPWADAPTKKAEQPQYDKNYYDSPHDFSPFEVLHCQCF